MDFDTLGYVDSEITIFYFNNYFSSSLFNKNDYD